MLVGPGQMPDLLARFSKVKIEGPDGLSSSADVAALGNDVGFSGQSGRLVPYSSCRDSSQLTPHAIGPGQQFLEFSVGISFPFCKSLLRGSQ